MSQPDLESALFALGESVEWPSTPRFRTAERRRLPSRRLAALAAAAAILILGGAALAGGRLLRSVEIQRVPSIPPTASPAADPLRLGDRYTRVADAERAAGFPLLVPADLGQPVEIRVRRQPVVMVTLAYAPGGPVPPSPVDPSVGLLVTEYRGSGDTLFVQKLAGPETRIVQVTVAGARGVWLEGAPHQVFVAGRPDELRLATSTLLWERDGMTYRIEAAISQSQALQVAGTMR